MSKPVTYVQAGKTDPVKSSTELWQYRDLLLFFILRDFKVRYRQTIIGVGWTVLQPVLQLTIFTLLFSRLLQFKTHQAPYALFVLSALIPWNFWANGITACNYAIINHAGLIRKVYFPRLIIPLSALGMGLLDILVTFLLMSILLLFYKIPFTLSLLWILPLLWLLFLITLGCGAVVSAMGVRYRDVRHVIPFLVQIWFFLTPVLYSSQTLPPQSRWWLYLNPLAGLAENFRAAILHQAWQPDLLLAAIGWSILLFGVGITFFQRQARQFADYI